jgi:hypothetical protein
MVAFHTRTLKKTKKIQDKLISSSGLLRKSYVEIDFYRCFLKETFYKNHGFVLMVFLRNRHQY